VLIPHGRFAKSNSSETMACRVLSSVCSYDAQDVGLACDAN
jgi:hypothetical protein